MTREEAIEVLKTDSCMYCGVGAQSPCTCEFDGHCDIKDAIDMAIKALEQEPCEDAVSRQAVKDGMIKYGFRAPDMTVTEFIEDELQPVIPAREIGQWITDGSSGMCYCSKCGFGKSQLANGWCAACGARMKDENKKSCNDCAHHTNADEIHGITPCDSCGVDLKNFKRKTEMDSKEDEKH